jgi:hypothetical protein
MKVAILIVLLREAQGLNEQYEKILLPIDLNVRFDRYGNMRQKVKILDPEISKKNVDSGDYFLLIYICIYIYIYIYIYICIYINTYVYIYIVYLHIDIYIYKYIHVYAYLSRYE